MEEINKKPEEEKQPLEKPETEEKPPKGNIELTEEKKDEYTTPVDPNVQLYISDAISKLKDNLTSNFVTILAIFASFITFLGVEVQIIKSVCDFWRLIGFSSFILAAVLIFIFAIYIFVDTTNKKGWMKIFGILLIIFLLLSFALFSLSRAGDEYACQEIQMNNKFTDMENQYSNKNNQQIKDLDSRLNTVEKILKIK